MLYMNVSWTSKLHILGLEASTRCLWRLVPAPGEIGLDFYGMPLHSGTAGISGQL